MSRRAEGQSPRRPDCAGPTSALHRSRFLESAQASPLWVKDPGPQADRSLRSFKCWRWSHITTAPDPPGGTDCAACSQENSHSPRRPQSLFLGPTLKLSGRPRG